MNKIKLSLIIPVYNVEIYIERCLRSILFQLKNNSDVEIIIINDGSTDRSKDILCSFSKNVPNIFLYHQSNKGLSEARNFGLSIAKGEYIWFIDSDDYILEDSLASIFYYIDIYKFEILAFGRHHGLPTSFKIKKQSSFRYNEIVEGRYFFNTVNFQVPVFLYIFKRLFLIKNNLFFEKNLLHEDFEFTPRALFLCREFLNTDKLFYFHFKRDNSISNSVNPKRCYDLILISKLLRCKFKDFELSILDQLILNRICFFALTQSIILCSQIKDAAVRKNIYDKILLENEVIKSVLNDNIFFKIQSSLILISPSLFASIHRSVGFIRSFSS